MSRIKNGTYIAPNHITDELIMEAMKQKEIRDNGGKLKLHYCEMLCPISKGSGSFYHCLVNYYENNHDPLSIYDTVNIDTIDGEKHKFRFRAKKRRKIIFKAILYSPIYLFCLILECISSAFRSFIVKQSFGERFLQAVYFFLLLMAGLGLVIFYEIHTGEFSSSSDDIQKVIYMYTPLAGIVSLGITFILAQLGKDVNKEAPLSGPLHTLLNEAKEYNNGFWGEPADFWRSFDRIGNPDTITSINNTDKFITYYGETAIYFAGTPRGFHYKYEDYPSLQK